MNVDLKIIKKYYGEAMSHFCREAFPSILEYDGVLSQLLLKHFYPTHYLYDDLFNNDLLNYFESYINGLFGINNYQRKTVSKSPQELFNEIGYYFYECHSEEDIKKFKSYYADGEELCTFKNNRLNKHYVFFVVKKNVLEIKRENFKNPQREDEYGTSVMSIQFDKNDTHRLSIKNRYNDSVPNPDATFFNNLDNIISGLSDSFEKYYGLRQAYKYCDFSIPNYIKINNKYYKYNYKINDVYYCIDNIIINNYNIYRYNKDKYLIIDYFVFDLENKKVYLYDESINDSFINFFSNIEKISITKLNKDKMIKIILSSNECFYIKVNSKNEIIGVYNNNITKINDNFLRYSENINILVLKNVEKIGDYFLLSNKKLSYINVDNVKYIGNWGLYCDNNLKYIGLNKAYYIGKNFLFNNQCLERINCPNLSSVGSLCLYKNKKIDLNLLIDRGLKEENIKPILRLKK